MDFANYEGQQPNHPFCWPARTDIKQAVETVKGWMECIWKNNHTTLPPATRQFVCRILLLKFNQPRMGKSDNLLDPDNILGSDPIWFSSNISLVSSWHGTARIRMLIQKAVVIDTPLMLVHSLCARDSKADHVTR